MFAIQAFCSFAIYDTNVAAGLSTEPHERKSSSAEIQRGVWGKQLEKSSTRCTSIRATDVPLCKALNPYSYAQWPADKTAVVLGSFQVFVWKQGVCAQQTFQDATFIHVIDYQVCLRSIKKATDANMLHNRSSAGQFN